LDPCEDAKAAELKKQEEERNRAREEVERLAKALGGGQQGGSAIGETDTQFIVGGIRVEKGGR
jgi:hypothetical protein